jgi:hypothetical protein
MLRVAKVFSVAGPHIALQGLLQMSHLHINVNTHVTIRKWNVNGLQKSHKISIICPLHHIQKKLYTGNGL